MNPVGELIVGLVILIGLIGIVLPVLPGLILVLGAVLVWALEEGSVIGWAVFAVSLALAVVGSVVKYLVPGKRLKESGIALTTIAAAGVGAIVGFFIIPVVGAAIGFMAGIYVVQWGRLGRDRAWPATKRTAGAIALSVGIELGAGLLIAGVWLIAVLFG
mgnify:FL=1